MKILITTDWYLPTTNGVVTSVINLKNELIKRGHEVKILTLVQADKECRDEEAYYIKSFSAGIIYPQARILRSLGIRQIRELIRWKPDVIHSQCEFSTYLMALFISRQTKAPIIHTYHTVYEDYTHYFSKNGRLGRKAVKIFTRAVLKKTQEVIAPTEKVHTLLKNYKIKAPIHTIPTGIDVSKYADRIDTGILDMHRRELGIDRSEFVLLYLGRVAKEKNLHELIEFLSRIEAKNLTFLIVGDGPEMDEIRTYAEKTLTEIKVVFAGRVERDKVNEYYQLGDIFVSASTSETQGLTYIEALANGLPLLCRRDDCLEGVLINGVNGFQYSNFEEFRKYLGILDHDGHIDQKYQIRARKSAGQFSKEKFGEDMEKVYCEVLEAKRSNLEL